MGIDGQYRALVGRSTSPAAAERYSSGAIVLHWLIAAAMFAQIGLGLYMVEVVREDRLALKFSLYQWHKSLGITILLLTLVRIVWRLTHRVPPLPDTLRPWERVAARFTHTGFYVLLVALPMTGWAMVSTAPFPLPTLVYGRFIWPHIPGLEMIAPKSVLEPLFRSGHATLAFVAIGGIALHLAAVAKHALVLRDDVLARMLPGRKRGEN